MTPETQAEYVAELRYLLRRVAADQRRIEELQKIVEWPPKQRRAA
jgi:hypothetical protein